MVGCPAKAPRDVHWERRTSGWAGRPRPAGPHPEPQPGRAPPSRAASMNVALYAGLAGGLVAALILVGVGVYCCCCRKAEAEDARP